MTSPLVSVCIPAYNQERYIEAAVNSVLSQTFSDFELIIVDDCSQDATYERLQAISDPRIRLSRNERNLGLEGNWNAAIEQARGTYIKVFCGDDLLFPECLERQVGLMQQPHNAGLALTATSRRTLTPAGKPVFNRIFFKKDKQLSGTAAIRESLRRGTNIFGEPGAVLFRRALLEKTGPFDGSIPYLIDLDMWIRLLLHGDVLILSEPLFGFRVSNTSLSFFLSSRQSKEFSQLIEKIKSVPGVPLSEFDALRGKCMAYYTLLLRNFFYFLYVRGK